MDFFKSVFNDTTPSPTSNPTSQNPETAPPPASSWAMGSTLFRTIASKSESLLDNYYKDFQEFSSGLKKETSVIREAASRAVQDLPARLDSGAAIAQESLEAVGQAIDNVGSTVSQIIGKDLDFVSRDGLSSSLLNEIDDSVGKSSGDYSEKLNFSENAKPYSRREALIRAMQCDVKTYCEGVEEDDYDEWRKGFRIEECEEEIEKLFEENGVVKEIFDEIVPVKVDEDTFWCRYFYRVDKVVKAEEARLRIVKRAILAEEEELSWDVDDDDDDNGLNDGYMSKDKLKKEVVESGKNVEDLHVENGQKEMEASGSGTKSDALVYEENLEEGLKVEEKAGSEGKIESDFSVISSQRSSHVEDDFGWDEIEDIGGGYESKVADQGSRSPGNKVDFHKRLNAAAEDDEELTWDIEDDDKP